MTSLAEAFSKTLVNDIHKCSLMKQTGVSLKYMMDFGSKPTARNLLLSAQFLHKELPIRLAHRVVELESLPYGLSSKPPVLKVRDWYVDSFRDIRYFPEIRDSIDDFNFTEMIGRVKMRHNNVVPTMAMGVQQLKQDLGQKIGLNDLLEIHQFLDGFYMSRIGIRMLVGQHVALHDPNPQPRYIGLICTRTSPLKVAESAIDEARSMCVQSYASAPVVHVYGDPSFTFLFKKTNCSASKSKPPVCAFYEYPVKQAHRCEAMVHVQSYRSKLLLWNHISLLLLWDFNSSLQRGVHVTNTRISKLE